MMNFDCFEEFVKEVSRKETEFKERSLAKAIEENDFIVGSPVVKATLENKFPDMHVVYSKYLDPQLIVMVKKFVIGEAKYDF